jgi:hypothetical protein
MEEFRYEIWILEEDRFTYSSLAAPSQLLFMFQIPAKQQDEAAAAVFF